MVRPHRKACQINLHSLTCTEPPQTHCSKTEWGGLCEQLHIFCVCIFIWTVGTLYVYVYTVIVGNDYWLIIKTRFVSLDSDFECMYIRLYLGRCWRWIRKPDSRTDSSQIGVSTPDSTSSWTAREKEGEEGEREEMSSVSREWKTWETLWYKIPCKMQQYSTSSRLLFNYSVKSVGTHMLFPPPFSLELMRMLIFICFTSGEVNPFL